MSARPRSYQRIGLAEGGAEAPTSTTGSSGTTDSFGHIGSLDDDDGDTADDPEPASDGDDDDEEEMLKKRRSKRSKQAALWSTKLHAFLWVVTAGTVCYAIDFFHVIFTDERIRKGYFHVALVCFGINTCITLYLSIWLPYIRKINLEWSVYCPRMIPTATVVGVIATFCFVCAFWPVWGLLTPGLLALFFIGSLMTAHFLPSI